MASTAATGLARRSRSSRKVRRNGVFQMPGEQTQARRLEGEGGNRDAFAAQFSLDPLSARRRAVQQGASLIQMQSLDHGAAHPDCSPALGVRCREGLHDRFGRRDLVGRW